MCDKAPNSEDGGVSWIFYLSISRVPGVHVRCVRERCELVSLNLSAKYFADSGTFNSVATSLQRPRRTMRAMLKEVGSAQSSCNVLRETTDESTALGFPT